MKGVHRWEKTKTSNFTKYLCFIFLVFVPVLVVFIKIFFSLTYFNLINKIKIIYISKNKNLQLSSIYDIVWLVIEYVKGVYWLGMY